MNTNNVLGYAEVVDTLADSITVYRTISQPLQDGFQFPDLLALYEAYPHLMEVYNDRRQFAAEFIDLTPEESVEVLKELSTRTGVPQDRVEQVAFRSLSVVGRTYRLISNTLAEVQDLREEVFLIFRTEEGKGPGVVVSA